MRSALFLGLTLFMFPFAQGAEYQGPLLEREIGNPHQSGQQSICRLFRNRKMIRWDQVLKMMESAFKDSEDPKNFERKNDETLKDPSKIYRAYLPIPGKDEAKKLLLVSKGASSEVLKTKEAKTLVLLLDTFCDERGFSPLEEIKD